MIYAELSKKKLKENAEIILFNLGNLKNDEKLCIISDKETKDLGSLFYSLSQTHKINSKHFIINPLKMHGEEPPHQVSNFMKDSNLIIGLTKLSMAHTKARQIASLKGARYLSLPDYSKEILMHKALQVNYYVLGEKAKALANRFSEANKIHILTKNGTNLELNIKNRKGNFAPGYVNQEILLGSPPDIEANVAPLEEKSRGKVVVDGSIPVPGLGKLENPIILEIENGKICSISGEKSICNKIKKLFDSYGGKSMILAECGVGFNKESNLCGNMLIDEGTYGTIHLGFGSNTALGGLNSVDFHLDFVFFADEIILDDECIKI